MKTIVCIDCARTVERTGPAQKRCPDCRPVANKANQKVAAKRWAVNTGRFKGTGPGAHNTPGDLHPQWNGGERKFGQTLAPAYYKRVRYCERCGLDLVDAAPEFRAVHHKDHNRKNNVESNFELLCKRCHQLEHECWLNLPNQRRD